MTISVSREPHPITSMVRALIMDLISLLCDISMSGIVLCSTHFTGINFTVGTYNVTYWVWDPSGNNVSCTFVLHVDRASAPAESSSSSSEFSAAAAGGAGGGALLIIVG